MIRVKSVPFLLRVIDFLLNPVMWILSGCKRDSIQETHPWHTQTFACESIPNNIGIEIIGDDVSRFSHFSYGVNHMPFLGGWKKYIVFEAQSYNDYWYIGWKVIFNDTNKKTLCQIHKLRIYTPTIKVLVGINDSRKIFFGFNKDGEPLQLKEIGKGELGDNKYPKVRLF